ncbi:fibroblast growth factor receptor 3-like [Lutzomyia longipalpis]|uniref:fibroblast growth factor receptor 3-like n=1 Tax=Lutzomyia longipalpis TaxID=7200 RepID=UPI0024844899|nr:fibroblast growth factor receptor 3-like [Lutzomyia longipalpis]XP_055695747.1 fibroblast growth factor receptor 3-like [Lutzomyia longipalpis]XP_055695748.1 fibroblast growth factor receptor 3-like [Lutzomyia longipalpis]XP_055695749.1 fibroblast growth factor receptor 3-like [Lutzomyia longipalpis]XP_055695750.1 fibroblast growth factor receptor 3-like [Lutzomyia longipalpis]XP_055695751.1 fibroblast growth factor receptor 3-like [Lutzomyia longipalpis]XP_055695752.1 fibroblast growth fa
MRRRRVTLLLIELALVVTLAAARGPPPPILRPRDGDPFDTLPKSFWQEFSSPFTDTPEGGDTDDSAESLETTTREPQPFFEEPLAAANITTQLGSHVHLHCRVNDLREKTVSWVRRKEDQLQLITFGRHTYSSDSRYQLEYQPPNDWQLLIQFANERDEGHYECQVSSHPPLVFLVYLTVVVPRVEIVDERGGAGADKFYKAGSTIELKCVITKVPQPTTYVTWKHGQRMLNYDTSRGGISVKTDLKIGGAVSRLYIANANRYDSGNYTCALADVAMNTVTVHVLNGENPAAMQHGGSPRWTPIAWATVFSSITHLFVHRR